MLIREVLPEERESYNETVDHILQSYEWGVFRESTGVKVVRMGTYQGNILTSGFQLTIHPLPVTSYSIGYFPKGRELTPELLEQITKIGQEHSCIFIKTEPTANSQLPTSNKQEATSNKKEMLLINSQPILPQHTFIVDLMKTEEEILNGMKEKTRYNIRLAEKQGVTITEKSDKESLEIFIKLAMETAERQGFFSHPADYYRKLWEILYPHQMVHLLLAKYQETPLAAIMLFKFKNNFYYPYGGSATVMREKMPNHLLHWEAIKLGKRLGCTTYDMWGAYKDNPSEKDPWFGIYRFKEGFGGKLIDFALSKDLVLNPGIYKLYNFLNPIRFKIMACNNFILNRIKKL